MGRKSIIPEIEAKISQPLKEYLVEAIKNGKSPPEIASELGVSQSLAYDFISKYGLKSKLTEARRQAAAGVKEGELYEAIEDYINWKKRSGFTEATLRNTRQFFRSWTWWLDYAKVPTDIDHACSVESVEAFMDYCREVTPRFGGKNAASRRPMSKRTYNNILTNLIAFLHYLEDVKEAIETKEVTKIKKTVPKVKEEEKTPEDLPDEIIKKIRNSFDNSFEGIRNKAILTVFIETGMRLDGVNHMKRHQFNLETGWGKVVEKGKKERDIRMSAALLETLKSYIPRRDKIAKCDDLWIKADGSRFPYGAIEKMVMGLNQPLADDLKRLCPGQRIHPHVFRHIWAKFLVESNVGIQAIADMGGWNDLKLVQHYARAHQKRLAWSEFEKASPLKNIMEGGE